VLSLWLQVYVYYAKVEGEESLLQGGMWNLEWLLYFGIDKLCGKLSQELKKKSTCSATN
jgi:hypothetical protein